jgi:hypothetical protein
MHSTSDLEPVAYPEDWLARLHEVLEVIRQLALEPRGEYGSRAHVVARGETSGEHEDLVVGELPPLLREHVAPCQLFQVDLLGLRPES